MFIVADPEARPAGLVFIRTDPRASGYVGSVTAGVSLYFDPTEPQPRAGPVGRHPDYVIASATDDPLVFIVFQSAQVAAQGNCT